MVRRSSRATRQPELFVPTKDGGARPSYADYGTSEDEGPNFVTAMRKRKATGGSKKKKDNDGGNKGEQKKRVRAKKAAETDEDSDHTSDESEDISNEPFSKQLFETMRVGKSSAMKRLSNAWVKSFCNSRVEATTHIINFILRCAGTEKDWVASDVDLDGMLPEDMDELLRDMVEWMERTLPVGQYPLGSLKKETRANRVNFKKFWSIFASTLVKSMSSSKDGSSLDSDLGVLHTVVEQLVSLSSSPVVHIRNVVTEAVLRVGKELVSGARTLDEQLATSRRLEEAERKKTSGKGTKKTPKHEALVEQIEILGDAAESIESLYTDIFAAVFVHRCNDGDEDIRALSVKSLSSWLVSYPAKLWKSEKLQYIGTLTHDKKTAVRKSCLSVLDMLMDEYDDDRAKELEERNILQSFVDDFGERLVEMCYDVDEHVARTNLNLLRKAQEPSRALLDSMETGMLDLVDRLIFDPNASLKLRQAAANFMMDHTEGFGGELDAESDEEEEDAQPAKKSKKGRGSKSHSKAELRALERRRETAQQLETLTEFVDMHMEREGSRKRNEEVMGDLALSLDYFVRADEKYDLAVMLAEAMYGLEQPRSRIIRDWPTIISLLHRESDGELTTTLEATQASILLRMFVTTALQLHRDVTEIDTMSPEERSKVTRARREKHSHDEDDWEALKEHAVKDLPVLLTRFRDDESNLEVLSGLIKVCEPTNKNAKPLVKTCREVFERSQSTPLFINVAASFRAWMLGNSTATGIVKPTVSDMLSSIHSSILDSHACLSALSLTTDNSSSSSSSSSSSKKAAKDAVKVEEEMVRMGFALSRFSALLKNLDALSFMKDVDVSDFTDSLVEIADQVITLRDRAMEVSGHTMSVKSNAHYARSAKGAADCIFMLMLWFKKKVHDATKAAFEADTAAWQAHEARELDDMDTGVNEMLDFDGPYPYDSTDVEAAMAKTVELRDKLVDVLSTWMDTALGANGVGVGDDYSAEAQAEAALVDPVMRDLRLFAFSKMGDLRVLFGLLRQSRYEGQMAWNPAQGVMLGMKHTFEKDGEVVKAKYDELVAAEGEEDEGTSDEVAVMLRDVFFLPLARFTLAMETDDVNRTQAAAAVTYLMHASPVLRNASRRWIKEFKSKHGMVKFLDVQLVALRRYYTDNCVAHLRDVDAALEEGTQEQLEDAADEGCERTIMLASKLVQQVGVGKLKNASDVDALRNFLITGIDYSFTEPMNAGFCEVMWPVLRLLPKAENRTILDYINSRLQETNDYDALDRDSREWHAVIELKKRLSSDKEAAAIDAAAEGPTPRRHRSPKARGSARKKANLEEDLSGAVDSESESDDAGQTYASFMAQERQRDMSLTARPSMAEQSTIIMERDDEATGVMDVDSSIVQDESENMTRKSSIVLALDLESVHGAGEEAEGDEGSEAEGNDSDEDAFNAPPRRRR